MKPLHSHIGALAMFSRRVHWQRKGKIQRLKQPESADIVYGIRNSTMLLLLWMKVENKLVRGPTWVLQHGPLMAKQQRQPGKMAVLLKLLTIMHFPYQIAEIAVTGLELTLM